MIARFHTNVFPDDFVFAAQRRNKIDPESSFFIGKRCSGGFINWIPHKIAFAARKRFLRDDVFFFACPRLS